MIFPLDTLKTRWQSQDFDRLYRHASSRAINKQALSRGLYQGIGSVIFITLPASGAFFTTYEAAKSTLSKHGSSSLPLPVINAAASGFAELVSCAIITPAEVIKQNAQMVQDPAASGSGAARSIKVSPTTQVLRQFKQNPLALWRGYTALASRNIPFVALQFPMFEMFKSWISEYRDRRGMRTGTLLESGLTTATGAGLAGGIAAVVTNPIDVIKTRIMLSAGKSAQASAASSSSTSPESAREGFRGGKGPVDAIGRTVGTQAKGNGQAPLRKSSFQIGREIMAEQGIKGLWRGGTIRAVWTVIGSALYLGVYESGRIYLAQRRDETLLEEDIL